MTLNGGSSHACAACKYRRSKCSSECLLAVFFPSDNPKIFENAHRLFGVKNIVKVLKPLDQFLRCEAMKSIIFESNMREQFPVDGCCLVINRLDHQIRLVQEELQSIRTQLKFYIQDQQQPDISCISELQLSMGNLGSSDNPIQKLSPETDHIYLNVNIVDFDSVYTDKDEMVTYCIQNPDSKEDNISNGDNNLKLMQSEIINPEEVNIQQQKAQEYDEIHQFFDAIDDRQSFVNSKGANDSSSDSSLKDTSPTLEFVSDNELKNAAML